MSRDWLLTSGFDEAEVAIKTAEQNDLSQPENQDLLSPTNRVRAIITKQALQEGWDCPFAYVLCALAANSNLKAMTQLVGRILRQPGAIKTEVSALDECHVITHRTDTATVVEAIKDGLEKDGLGDLFLQVSQDDTSGTGAVARKIDRRPAFASAEIYLPKVMIVNGGEARDLDYETDVLSSIDWRGFDPKDIAVRIPENAQDAESQLQRIKLADNGDELFVGETVAESSETLAFDPSHAVRMISDIVSNPFVGREIVGNLLAALHIRGFDNVSLVSSPISSSKSCEKGSTVNAPRAPRRCSRPRWWQVASSSACALTVATGECPSVWTPWSLKTPDSFSVRRAARWRRACLRQFTKTS